MFHIDPEEALTIGESQKLEKATQLKEEGLDLWKKKQIPDSFEKWSLAIKYIILINTQEYQEEDFEAFNLEKQKLEISLYNNLGNCHFLKGNWEQSIQLLSKVIQLDPMNVKALFRRGSSYIEIQEYEMAKLDLEIASRIEPTNSAIQGKIILLSRKVKELDSKLASNLKKMFS